jgi:hypothetical protein
MAQEIIYFPYFVTSSELVESDSDSGNELDKPLLSPNQKSGLQARISETNSPKTISKRKDPPDYSDDEEPLAFKSQKSDKKNLILQSKRSNKKDTPEEDNLVIILRYFSSLINAAFLKAFDFAVFRIWSVPR